MQITQAKDAAALPPCSSRPRHECSISLVARTAAQEPVEAALLRRQGSFEMSTQKRASTRLNSCTLKMKEQTAVKDTRESQGRTSTMFHAPTVPA
jgi:hypothetical protein